MTSSVLHKNKTLKTRIFIRWGTLYVTKECHENINAVYKVLSHDQPGVWCAVSECKITGPMFLQKAALAVMLN
jgi:hypothetical protein